MTVLCLSRQPIVDRDNTIIGYELLYRDNHDTQGSPEGCPQSLANGLFAALSHIGEDQVAGQFPPFINLSEELLLLPEVVALLPDNAVIEVVKESDFSPQLFERVVELKDAGFCISLDAFEPTPQNEHFIPLADIIKLDVANMTPEKVRMLVKQLSRKELSLMAEQVEDVDAYSFCRALPFDYFQGFYCGKPELFGRKRTLH